MLPPYKNALSIKYFSCENVNSLFDLTIQLLFIYDFFGGSGGKVLLLYL